MSVEMTKYKIGLTFSGNYREQYVEPFAKALLQHGFSQKDVFYDFWHDAEINGPTGGNSLRRIYHKECECVVVLLSPDYKEKNWPGKIEWPVIQELINEGKDEKICLLRVDNAVIGEFEGLFDYQSIAKSIDNLRPDDIAEFIAEKYNIIHVNNLCKESGNKLGMNETVLSHEFGKILYELYQDDGMMHCMYELYQKHASENVFSLSELHLLSIIQDEYVKLYRQFYSTRRVIDTKALDNLLGSKNVILMENNPYLHPWIASYLHFVRADRMYFVKDYDAAIKKYQEAYNKIKAGYADNEPSDNDEQICAYLLNSIGWSYFNRSKDDLDTAIQVYQQLFDEYPDVDTYFFSWRYRRNYGVCLENKLRYLDSIKQYKRALSDFANSEGVNKNIEYKVYLTSCSAMMKYWDETAGKVSGKWVQNTIEKFAKKEVYMTQDAMYDIEAWLELASKRNRNNIDMDNLSPDYYNQRTKLLTYKLMLDPIESHRIEYTSEIQKNLKILENVSPKAMGWHFIKRDANYVLFELATDKDDKEAYFDISWEENQSLDGKGDSNQFGEMLARKKEKYLLSDHI